MRERYAVRPPPSRPHPLLHVYWAQEEQRGTWPGRSLMRPGERRSLAEPSLLQKWEWREAVTDARAGRTNSSQRRKGETLGVCQKFYFIVFHFTQNDVKINPQ